MNWWRAGSRERGHACFVLRRVQCVVLCVMVLHMMVHASVAGMQRHADEYEVIMEVGFAHVILRERIRHCSLSMTDYSSLGRGRVQLSRQGTLNGVLLCFLRCVICCRRM